MSNKSTFFGVMLVIAASGAAISTHRFTQPASAQEEPATTKANGNDSPERRNYDAALENWRKASQVFWEQFQTFNTGQGDPRTSEQLAWASDESAMRHAMQQTMIAGTQLLKKTPDDKGVHDFLMRSIAYRSDHDWYEGLEQVAIAGMGSPLTNQQGIGFLKRLALLSAVANNDYETAEKFVDKETYPEEDDEIGRLAFRYSHECAALKEQWAGELKLRQAEQAADDLPRVVLKTTRGEVVLELYENEAPNTVASFISLVDSGFYDSVPFYQVVPHEFVQTGDQDGDGSGKADYRIADEAQGERAILRGSLVMAKMPNPAYDPETHTPDSGVTRTITDSASSQFLIVLLPFSPGYDELTCFGRVIDGMDAVSTLNVVNAQKKKEEDGPTLLPDLIIEAEVIRRREHAYEPTKLPF